MLITRHMMNGVFNVFTLRHGYGIFESKVYERNITLSSDHYTGIPSPPSVFIDREDETKRFLSLLGTHPVVMVKGLPGIGKSAFVAHAVRQWSGWQYGKKVVWCRCLPGMGLRELLGELLSCCGPVHGEFLSELLKTDSINSGVIVRFLASLEDVGIVPVIDDAHRFAGREFELFIDEACHFLRESALVLIGSQITAISPVILSEIATVRLGSLPPAAAVSLCEKLFEAHGERLPDKEVIEKAVEMTGGHPLFVRWLVGLSLQQRKTLADVLSGRDIGELGSRLIEPLWGTISPLEKTLMRYLAILDGTAGRWLLESSLEGADSAISSLSDRMLVETDPYEGTVRLSLPVREFIFHEMAENEETDVFKTYGLKLLSVLRSRDPASIGRYALKAYRLLLASEEPEAVIEAANLMAPFLFKTGRYTELAAVRYEIGRDVDTLPPDLVIAVVESLAVMGHRAKAFNFFKELTCDNWNPMDRFRLIQAVLDRLEPPGDVSRALLDEAERLFECFDSPELEISLYLSRAVVLWREGDLPTAKKFLGKALAKAKKYKLPTLIAEYSQRLAMILVREGKLTAGLRVLRMAGEALRGSDATGQHAALFGNRGTIHKELGNVDKAMELFKKGLAIRESLGDRLGMSTVHNNIGLLLFQLRRLDEADRHLLKSLECLEGIFDPLARATTLNNRALVATVKGELEQACLLVEESLELLEGAGHEQARALCYTNLAIYRMMTGDTAGSIKARTEAQGVANRVSNPRLVGTVYQRLGQLFRLEGFIDEAERVLREALEKLKNTEALKEIAFVYTELAEVALERPDSERALEWIELAEKSFPSNTFPWLTLTWLAHRVEAALLLQDKQVVSLANLLLDESEKDKCWEFKAKAYLLLRETCPEEYADLNKHYNACRMRLNRQELFWVDDMQRRLAARFGEGSVSWAGAEYRIIRDGESSPADSGDVEQLRQSKDQYALWLDVEKKNCHEKKRGDIPLFRKRVLAPLMLFFMRNPGSRFSAEAAFEKVWGVTAAPGDRSTFMVNLTRLRQLVEADPENPRYILTDSGIDGRAEYYFNPDASACMIEPL